MENLCRLCAVEKSPKELIYYIDDGMLNIEQKLIDCCRWNLFIGDENQEFPKRICIGCFQKLEQSWDFAEKVAQAQQTFHTLTVDVKPFALLQIDQTDSPLNEELCDPKEEIQDIFVSCDPPSSPETSFSEVLSQHCNYEIPINSDSKENLTKLSVQENTESKQDFDLLAVLSDYDKNSDGTVNNAKIVELNLDDWSIIKWNCWICNELFDNQRLLRFHFRRYHSDKTLRLQCALCNTECAKWHSIHLHIIKNHRSYLKFWYVFDNNFFQCCFFGFIH